MKRRRIIGALLSFLMLSSAVVGLVPLRASAEAVEDPEGVVYDANGYLTIENQEALAAKIKEAQDLGVIVTEKEEKKSPVYVGDTEKITSAKNEIKTHNQQQITALEEAITKQNEKDKAYKDTLKASFDDMLKSEWTFDQLCDFVLTEEEKNASEEVKLRRLVEKMSATSIITYNSETELDEASINLKKPGYFTKGDSLRYNKVFQEGRSKDWVDMRFTVQDIRNRKTKDSVDKVKLITHEGVTGYYDKKPWFLYQNFDMQMKVDFLKHGTDESISVVPIIVIVDVDGTQGVGLDSPTLYNVLAGKRVTQDPNISGKYVSDAHEDSPPNQGKERQHWVMYTMGETNSFTYTFYSQDTDFGILQGIGGDDIGYKNPGDAPEPVSVSITIEKQPVYHKVTYRFVGEVPEGVNPPVDETMYLLNATLVLRENPAEVKDDKGTWTFQGWFSDEACTAEMKDGIAVNKDLIIYGKWALAPKDTPKPPKPPVPKKPETPEKPETLEQPETPEKPVQERIPATPSIDLKAILDRTEVRIPRAGVGAPTH